MRADVFGVEPLLIGLAIGVTLFAGVVKGVVGFAMPMIMISGLGSFLAAEIALALLIIPTLVTNVQQAFRQGWSAAVQVVRDYWRMLLVIVIGIALSAQIMTSIPQGIVFALLGGPITFYAAIQLMGRSLRFNMVHKRRWEVGLGAIGGFYGGISGVWGPPLIAYLLSAGVEKTENVRVQGVIYMLGSVMLAMAHMQSGVLNAQTLPLSALMVVPAVLGMWLGFKLQDKLDQVTFVRWTLVVLMLSGLNLVRRALVV
ncbi:sulfite exporter TauE/SafE family protein [Alkalilacustris brevis]|uniref:sulfite exporter TauE/SafE family protein n=1 Tax=Alkalilacustris brevis TaxID=2026338 RepID=UPI001EE3C183|nr:sulfite exporter TauE/SafE family protein [Alkalilacustris brevis]